MKTKKYFGGPPFKETPCPWSFHGKTAWLYGAWVPKVLIFNSRPVSAISPDCTGTHHTPKKTASKSWWFLGCERLILPLLRLSCEIVIRKPKSQFSWSSNSLCRNCVRKPKHEKPTRNPSHRCSKFVRSWPRGYQLERNDLHVQMAMDWKCAN